MGVFSHANAPVLSGWSAVGQCGAVRWFFVTLLMVMTPVACLAAHQQAHLKHRVLSAGVHRQPKAVNLHAHQLLGLQHMFTSSNTRSPPSSASPQSVSDEALARVFRAFPGMEYCDLKKDRATGRSKGYAYVSYLAHEAAAAAQVRA